MSDKNVDFMRKTDGEEVGNSTLPTQQNKKYPCIYFVDEKCTKFAKEDGYEDWCVMGPCSHQVYPSDIE